VTEYLIQEFLEVYNLFDIYCKSRIYSDIEISNRNRISYWFIFARQNYCFD
jgi:hypothetical protein